MAQERGRHDQVRRHHRRDRDRQGDHGSGSRRTKARSAKFWLPEGTADVAVNTPIAVILNDGEDASSMKAEKPAAPAKPETEAEANSRSEGRSTRSERKQSARRARCRSCRRSRRSRRHRDGDHDHARSLARRDGRGNAPRRRCLRHGRGSRRISGRLQSHAGPVAGIRRQARHRHADHRTWLCRPRRRRRACRIEADRRVHDLQLRHAGDRPDHQLRRQDALYVGRPDGLPDRVPRPERRRRPRRRAAQPGLFGLVLATFRA